MRTGLFRIILYLEGGGVAMGGGKHKARGGFGGDAERHYARSVGRNIVFAPARQLPRLFRIKLFVALFVQHGLKVRHHLIPCGALFHKVQQFLCAFVFHGVCLLL